MKVTLVYEGDGVEILEFNGHRIQFSGQDGDGYCYAHQSVDCIDNLTEEEWNAIGTFGTSD